MELNVRQIDRVTTALERIAAANENLITLAREERDQFADQGFPPYCPHCQFVNPVVRVAAGTREGYISDYIVAAECQNCGQTFYAMATRWEVTETIEQASQWPDSRTVSDANTS